MTFSLGNKSRSNLVGVHPTLVGVVELAIRLSAVDFRVYDGLRTAKEQQAQIDAGVSWTMNSRHLSGHAVDLVPLKDGKLSWDWELCYKVARAMQYAARAKDVRIVWGGVWDKILNDLSGNLHTEVLAYSERRKKLGKSVKTDGPHFELLRKEYP